MSARAFKAGDTITIGSTTGVTISAINYSTNVLTLAAGQTWTSGAVVFCDSLPGSEKTLALLDEFINLRDQDTQLLKDTPTGKLLVRAGVKSAMVLGDLAAIRAATNGLSQILWDDTQGLI